MSNMYDEKGMLKPEFELTESERKKMFYNNDLNINYYGKGNFYKGVDGKEYASMEEVEAANKRYWDNLMKNQPQQLYTRFSEIEEKYFNNLTKMFNIGEKYITERSQVEIAVAYMKERYESYLLSLLEQYNEQKNNGPKK